MGESDRKLSLFSLVKAFFVTEKSTLFLNRHTREKAEAMQTKRLFRFIPVLWALSLTWRFSRAAINEPSEFLHSFLSRSQLLENSSTRQEPLLKHHNVLAVSVYVENWSDYKLVYSGHSVTAGSLDTSFPPRNMAEKKRGFALR